MKVLVLGGAGIVGKAIAKDLVEQADVSKVVLADMNVERAEKYLNMLGSPKATAQFLDASDYDNLVKVMKDFDVIANSVYYGLVIPITKAAVEAKTHCVDLGGFWYGTLKQMDMNEEIEKAGITVLHGCGSGPGLNNVICRYAADRMDRLETIDIRAGGAAPAPDSKGVTGAGMTIQTVLDEKAMNPNIFEDGEYKKVPSISGAEVVKFPDPIGEQTAYFSLHSEPLTLSKNIKTVQSANIKVVFPKEEIEKLTPLIEAGLASREPVEFKGHTIVPREFLDFLMVKREQGIEGEGREFCATVIYMAGQKNGEAVKMTYDYIIEHDKKWGNTKTGVPFSIGVLMVGRGEITKRGFTFPEIAIDPVKFIDECRKRGFVFTEKEEYIRNI